MTNFEIEIAADNAADAVEMASALAIATGLPVQLAQQKPASQLALEADVEELDDLLRQALLHIHRLMCLLEGPQWVRVHDYYREAFQFWRDLREGMCATSRIDGEAKMCPNQAIDGSWFCEECLDEQGGEARFIGVDMLFKSYP